MRWESADAATRSGELFQDLPTSARFMSMMAGPPKVAGRFAFIAGTGRWRAIARWTKSTPTWSYGRRQETPGAVDEIVTALFAAVLQPRV